MGNTDTGKWSEVKISCPCGDAPAAPAAKDGTYKRVCDPTGDKAAKCTYSCEQDATAKTEITYTCPISGTTEKLTCDGATGKWSPEAPTKKCTACKESTAPSDDSGTRTCDPSGDLAKTCTVKCLYATTPGSPLTETKSTCNVDTGKWDPATLTKACPKLCTDASPTANGVKCSPSISAGSKTAPGSKVVCSCESDATKQQLTCCDGDTGKWSPAEIKLTC